MIRKNRLGGVAAVALVLASSANADNVFGKFSRSNAAKRAQTEMVGMSLADVLACAGAPDRQASVGDTQILSYSTSHSSVYANQNTLIARNRDCQVNIVLQAGTVQKVNYSGDTGGLLTRGEQCGYIVQACLPPDAPEPSISAPPPPPPMQPAPPTP